MHSIPNGIFYQGVDQKTQYREIFSQRIDLDIYIQFLFIASFFDGKIMAQSFDLLT
ncbi:MAG: hypothetical protein M0P75_03665 [Candidatus Marinimicrobia bacterium]|nr:hypothetical protein [Candidatus Neomarinimicrobiota bacterium]